jgi:hypothetical protein
MAWSAACERYTMRSLRCLPNAACAGQVGVTAVATARRVRTAWFAQAAKLNRCPQSAAAFYSLATL